MKQNPANWENIIGAAISTVNGSGYLILKFDDFKGQIEAVCSTKDYFNTVMNLKELSKTPSYIQ